MKRTTKYVGLDVHQSATVATVRQEDGRVIARSVIPTEELAVVEFFRGMRGAIHVTFEEGTQAQWLHDLLIPRVERVVVCNRRKKERQGNKGTRWTPTSSRSCSGAGACAPSIMEARTTPHCGS